MPDEDKGLSLKAFFPPDWNGVLPPFSPCASYNEALDWLTWLDEDVGYVAHPVHPMLDLLRHPKDGHVVGFKVIGARSLWSAVASEVTDVEAVTPGAPVDVHPRKT